MRGRLGLGSDESSSSVGERERLLDERRGGSSVGCRRSRFGSGDENGVVLGGKVGMVRSLFERRKARGESQLTATNEKRRKRDATHLS